MFSSNYFHILIFILTQWIAYAWNNSKECLLLLLSHGAEGNIKDDVSNDHYMNSWVENNNGSS